MKTKQLVAQLDAVFYQQHPEKVQAARIIAKLSASPLMYLYTQLPTGVSEKKYLKWIFRVSEYNCFKTFKERMASEAKKLANAVKDYINAPAEDRPAQLMVFAEQHVRAALGVQVSKVAEVPEPKQEPKAGDLIHQAAVEVLKPLNEAPYTKVIVVNDRYCHKVKVDVRGRRVLDLRLTWDEDEPDLVILTSNGYGKMATVYYNNLTKRLKINALKDTLVAMAQDIKAKYNQ